MKAIAVFGGTFNPFHIGHEQMLSTVCELDYIDEVLLMPSKIPPHKSVDFLADDEVRLNMCRIASQKYKKVTVSDLEMKRAGKSYTIDTLLSLKKLYPDSDFFLVIGGDMVASFTEWREYEKILRLSGLIVFSRTTTKREDFACSIKRLRDLGANIRVIDTEIKDISSTELRNNFNDMLFLKNNLSQDVYEYLLTNNVYNKDSRINEFKNLLRNKLDDYRYNHSLYVADEAVALAEIFGCDKKDAYLAGLLHDITKNSSDEEHLNIFRSFDIILSDIEKGSKKLWHAISGAVFVKEVLRVEKPEIISAIRYHTTGKADMSLLEKIIYVADFTSADRDYPDVEVMRDLSRKSLEDAMVYALNYTINELAERGATVHPDTVAAYDFLINKKGEV